MTFNRDDPNTWPYCSPLIMAHDVGRSRDRSTAVIGGNSPFEPRVLGIKELEELTQGLYGSARASSLAAIDRRHNNNALIVADLSNDATYAEVLFETFGPRVIGLQITRHGDGLNAERRPVKNGSILVYNRVDRNENCDNKNRISHRRDFALSDYVYCWPPFVRAIQANRIDVGPDDSCWFNLVVFVCLVVILYK